MEPIYLSYVDEFGNLHPSNYATSTESHGTILNPSWDMPAWFRQNGGTHSCKYCHSQSPDDSKGNCAACGAPRK